MLPKFFSRRFQTLRPRSSRRRNGANPTIGTVQQLEDRTLLSGNVTATVNDGFLTVLGDDAHNNISVVVSENGGVEIFGFDNTTVNGVDPSGFDSPAYAVMDANIHSVIMNLGAGEDYTTLYGKQFFDTSETRTSLPGQLWVDLSDNHDTFIAESIDFWTGAAVYGRGGEDFIEFNDVGFGTGYFNGGAHADTINLNAVQSISFTSIWTGESHDTVNVWNSSFSSWLNIHGTGGNDSILVDNTSIEGHLYIAGGVGEDSLMVSNSSIGGFLGMYGGWNHDTLMVSDTEVGSYLWMTGSEGDDSLEALRTIVDQMIAMYGQGGDDNINLTDSSAYYVHLNGGYGADDIRSTGSSSMTAMTIYSGFGDDLASVSDTNINTFFIWNAGWGNDGFGMENSWVGGSFFAYGLFGDDIIGITNTAVGGDTFIDTGWGDDALILSDNGGANTFRGNVYANLNAGDDVVQVNGVHSFHKLLSLLGGLGVDLSNIDDGQDLSSEPIVFGIDSQDDASTRDRIDALLAALALAFPNFGSSPLASLFTVIFGDNPQVVLVLDLSGSTSATFQGTPVGDLNGDGASDTILDAQIAAAIAFNDEFIAAGLGGDTSITVVIFDSLATTLDLDPVTDGVQKAIAPDADINGNGIPDFNEAVMALRDGGSTNFEAALQEALTAFGEVQTVDGDANVIFLSDGFNNTGGAFDDEIAALQAIPTKLIAFGIGQGASLSELQTIDPKASIVDSTDDFINSLAGLI